MDWPEDVLEERRWREALYVGPESPLHPEARAAFSGLAWWPVDARFRVQDARLARHAAPKPAALATTGEDGVAFLEVGAFEFDLLGVPCRLLAFEPAPGEARSASEGADASTDASGADEAYILLPFRDATAGKETYGAGRYLDLEPTPHDVYDLDFNRAYHPYCAHDELWSCTLPPRENTLPVRVEAGERLAPAQP